MNSLKNNWAPIILIISLFVISIALIAEHIYFLIPCKMCLYERYTYYALITISLIFIFSKNQNNIIFYFLVEIFLLIGVILSLWHLGIENHIISGPQGCSATIENINSKEDLENFILNRPIVSCDEINWRFLGISIVIYNSLLQIVLLILNSIYLIKFNEYKK